MHIKSERRCVACRESKQQQDMIRVCKINDTMQIDTQNKLGGRGAYVCKNKDCIELTIKKRLFNRSFKSNLDVQIYEKLGEYEQNY